MRAYVSSFALGRDERQPCEDACAARQTPAGWIAALADGAGGAKAGGDAAHRAVETLVRHLEARPREWSTRQALEEFVSRLNEGFWAEGQQRYEGPELVCTLSAVVVEGDQLVGLNLGDSPVYLWREKALTRLSVPHVADGAALRHVLTRALGLEPACEPHVFSLTLCAGDCLLLCSDGVEQVLSPEAIAEQLGRGASARSLVTSARQSATEELLDDLSAVVIEVVEPGPTSTADAGAREVRVSLRVGDRVGDWLLEKPLAEGERVWLASSPAGERAVLKFPPAAAAEDRALHDAFVREAWNACRVQGEAFVSAFLPESGGATCYAMPYLEFPTLAEVLKERPLAVEEAIALGKFLAEACQSLVRQQLAHGDLKPENLLVLRRGAEARFKLLDLGSAAPLFSDRGRAGTASYLAPERFKQAPITERTELFAIGVTLFQSLCRAFPYGEIERYQTPRFDAMRSPLTLNPLLPGWLDAALCRALSPDPERRYQHYSEFAYDLEHPDQVAPFHRRDRPLLERNPLLFYKTATWGLLGLTFYLIWKLLER